MALNEQPPCNCHSTIRDYIATHYDPDGHMAGDEDPAEELAFFDHMCKSLGDDEGCEIDVDDMADYLAEIRERSAMEAR